MIAAPRHHFQDLALARARRRRGARRRLHSPILDPRRRNFKTADTSSSRNQCCSHDGGADDNPVMRPARVTADGACAGTENVLYVVAAKMAMPTLAMAAPASCTRE
jgi:hypothetical protein